MLPASGGNLSGGCNSAGSTSYDLISSGILLELNFFKVHFIGWSPSVQPEEADVAASSGVLQAERQEDRHLPLLHQPALRPARLHQGQE